jgi:hypothetical protein
VEGQGWVGGEVFEADADLAGALGCKLFVSLKLIFDLVAV